MPVESVVQALYKGTCSGRPSVAADPLFARSPELCSQDRICQDAHQSMSQCVWITGWHEQGSLTVGSDLGYRAAMRSDNGKAVRHRFQKDDAETLLQAGKAKHRSACVLIAQCTY